MKAVLNSSPIYLHFIAILFALLCAGLSYYKHRSNQVISTNRLYLLFSLRFLFVLFICYLTLNLYVKTVSSNTQKPIIAFAIDNSASMKSAKDSDVVRTELIKNLNTLSSELKNKFDLKFLKFGQKTQSLQSDFSGLTFTENESNFDDLFSTLDNNYTNLSIGALVLVSDGIYNAGANPVYRTKNIDYPILAVAIGDTTQTADTYIQKINHNSIAYLGNVFPVDVAFCSKKLSGKEVTISLKKEGKTISSTDLKINQQNFFKVVSFTVNATNVGLQKYDVSISLLPEEKNKPNNFGSFLIDVIDNKDKLLIVGNYPHPDIAAVKEVLDALGTYDVDCCLMNELPSNFKAYSAIVLHGGNEVTNSTVLKEASSNSIPIFRIATTEKLSFNRINEVTCVADKSFNLFSISDELKGFMNELPAVNAPFGNYSVASNEQALLYQKIGSVETQNPLLSFKEVNGVKFGCFFGDGLWRWKLRDFAEHQQLNLFTELISKSIQYLVVKNDKSFFRLNVPKILNESETIEFSAEVYNKSYELVNDGEVELTITSSENKNFQFTFSKTDKAYTLNAGQLAPGQYNYVAQTKIGNELFKKSGQLVVKALESEKINTVANHQLLNQLASSTQGKFIYQSKIAELKEFIEKNETIKPITFTQNATHPLIEFKWLFFIALILFGIEWYLRKIYLTI